MSVSYVGPDGAPLPIRGSFVYSPQVDPGNYIIQQDHEIDGANIVLEVGMLFVFQDFGNELIKYEHWILYESAVGGWPEGKKFFQFPSPENPKSGFLIINEKSLIAKTETPQLQDKDVFGHEVLLKANKITAKYILATCVSKPKVGFDTLDLNG